MLRICGPLATCAVAIAVSAAAQVLPTSESIFVFDSTGGTTYQGNSLVVGDVIDAFDPEGVRCGTIVIRADGQFGAMAVYKDDAGTPDVDEGARVGDAIHFKINGQSAEVLGGGTVIWTSNGDTKDVVLGVIGSDDQSHEIFGPGVFLQEGFEGDLAGWAIGTGLPGGETGSGQGASWRLVSSSSKPYSGGRSLEFSLDGRQEAGTIWLSRRLPLRVPPGSVVELRFRFATGSQGGVDGPALVVAYVGEVFPKDEGDLAPVEATADDGEWQEFRLEATVPSSSTPLWAAIGVSVASGLKGTFYLDDVTIETVANRTVIQPQSWGHAKGDPQR